MSRIGRPSGNAAAVAPKGIVAARHAATFASAVVDIARRDGVAVPASAVTRGERGRVVEVVRDGRVELRRVEVGLASRDLVELTEGVAPGEIVVARAAAFLRAGDAVRPIEPSVRESAATEPAAKDLAAKAPAR